MSTIEDPAIRAAMLRSHTAVRHRIGFGVWCNERKREATFLSQGHRGRYGRPTSIEEQEDAEGYRAIDRLASFFGPQNAKPPTIIEALKALERVDGEGGV